MAKAGSTNCHWFFGPSTPTPPSQLVKHRSPSSMAHGSARVLVFTEDDQEDLHNDDLLLLDRLRRRAALRAAKYQQDLRRYHSRKIRSRTSRQETLSSGESSPGKASTSSRLCGKPHTGWHTSPGPAQYASRQRTAYLSRTRGISRIYANSIRDHCHARQLLSFEGSTPLLLQASQKLSRLRMFSSEFSPDCVAHAAEKLSH